MNKTPLTRLCVNSLEAGAASALAAFATTTASAQVVPGFVAPTANYESSPGTGFHLSADLGSSLMQNFNSPRFGFPGHFSADPGLRFSIAPGYDLVSTRALTLGADVETGVIYNRIDKVEDSSVPAPGVRVNYYQVPLLAGLTLKFHPNSFLTPYVGISGGGDYSAARLHPRAFVGDTESSSDDLDPAVQGAAGLRMHLNSRSDLGLGYKYLAVLPGGSSSPIITHAVLASFDYQF
jgi:hypothetical protein